MINHLRARSILENQIKIAHRYNLHSYIKINNIFVLSLISPQISNPSSKRNSYSNSSIFVSSYISYPSFQDSLFKGPLFLPFSITPPNSKRKEINIHVRFPELRPTSDKFADGPLIPSNGRIIQDSGGALAVTRPEWRIKRRAPGGGRIAAACQASRDPKNFHLHRSKF